MGTVDPRPQRPQISLELQTVGSCLVWVPASFCPPDINLTTSGFSGILD